MRRALVGGSVAVAAVTLASTASAASLPYTVASQAAGRHVSDPERFGAIIGYHDQCVRGIPCWEYTKGSRAKKGSYPESWYLHVNGVRIRDASFGLFVMDPRSKGWQRHVARRCPERCFLDGLGPLSVDRTSPHLPWSGERWVKAAAQVVRAVRRAGKRALPNSIGTTPATSAPLVEASGGRASSEMFTPLTAQGVLGLGRVWVSERGDCAAKYHAFRLFRERGDHFACYEFGDLPWDTTSWL